MISTNNKSSGSNQEDVGKAVTYLNERFKRLSTQFNNDFIGALYKTDQRLKDSFSEMVSLCYDELEKNLQDKELPDPTSYFTQTGYMIRGNQSKSRKLLAKIRGEYFFHAKRKLGEYKETELVKQKELLQDAQKWLLKELDTIIDDSPLHITVFYGKENLAPQKNDRIGLRVFKFRKRTWSKITGKPVSVKIPFKDLLQYHLPARIQTAIYSLFKAYGITSFQHISSLQALSVFMKKSFNEVEERLIRGDFSHAFIQEEKGKAINLLSGDIKASSSSKGNEKSENKLQYEDSQEADNQLDLSQDEFELYAKLPNKIEKLIYAGFTKSLKVIREELNKVDIIGLLKKRNQLSAGSKDKLRSRLKDVPDKWYRNQVLFLSSSMMELMLIGSQNQMGLMVQKMVGNIEEIFEQNVIENLKTEYDTLSRFSKSINGDELTPFEVPVFDWGYARDKMYYKDINEDLMTDLKELVGGLPEQIEVMGSVRPSVGKKSLKEYEIKQYDKIETISIDLKRLVNFLAQNYMVEPLRQRVAQLPDYFNKTIGVAEDVMRLTSFSLNNADKDMFRVELQNESDQDVPNEDLNEHDPNGAVGFQKSILDFVNEGKTRVKNEMVKTKEERKQVLNSLVNSLELTCQKLDPDEITESAGNLKEYIRKTKKRNHLIARIKSLVPKFKAKVSRIWYSKSDSFLVARRINIDKESWGISAAPWNFAKGRAPMKLEDFILILESVVPKNSVLDALPFYYRQLFLGKHHVDRAFWTGRKNAMEAADKAVDWFKSGVARKDGFGSGGLLIMGEQNSGKTYLSQYIAGKYFDKKHIFHITPPIGGSTDIGVLKTFILEGIASPDEDVGIMSDLTTALESLPKGSVILFNDLELWWDRSGSGMQAIDFIIRLINHYSNQIFFIVNCNVYSLKQIKRMMDVSGSFLMEIPCEPFSAEELRDVILFRHKSTGLKYKLNTQREDDMTVWREAKLFSKYFDYSKGNVGVALQAWISNIDSVATSEKPGQMSYERNSGVLFMSDPKVPDLKVLKRMNIDWTLIIQQFILHNHLSSEKLSNISTIDNAIIGRVIKEMNKVGLIFPINRNENNGEDNNGIVYQINPYILPHLVNDMVVRGLL